MKKIFSGIQPTGNIHIGNYLGALKNWLELQNTHDCLFGIMNLHAITLKQDPIELQNNILKTAATYIACGLDPQKAKLFIQSEVGAHAELAWIFSTITPLGWLNRMTQFKDKVSLESDGDIVNKANYSDGFIGDKENKNANLGLYAYPVLMAADILLYRADIVPVGEDQKQHLELCRDIAKVFNHNFASDYFKLPQPLIIKETKRIMSLQDGNKKMSKSDPSEISRINLDDNVDDILKKIKKSKTDSLSSISYDENRKEIYNLINIFCAFSENTPQQILNNYNNLGYGKFKEDLASAIIQVIEPINKKTQQLINDKVYLQKILQEGKEYANEIAQKTRNDVYKIIGLI